MQKPNRAEAAKNADEAIKKLKEAQDEIEKRLKQLRQEEQEKALKNLEERVKRMLAMQLEVLDATRAIDSAIVKAGGAKTNAEDQKSQQQADQEGKIAVEAEQALALLAAEGSAVAFAGILAEVRLDMLAVQRRLNDHLRRPRHPGGRGEHRRHAQRDGRGAEKKLSRSSSRPGSSSRNRARRRSRRTRRCSPRSRS